jgi:hypothetical protein
MAYTSKHYEVVEGAIFVEVTDRPLGLVRGEPDKNWKLVRGNKLLGHGLTLGAARAAAQNLLHKQTVERLASFRRGASSLPSLEVADLQEALRLMRSSPIWLDGFELEK